MHERLLFSRASPFRVVLIFENWQLEVERELQLIYEIWRGATSAGREEFLRQKQILLSVYGRTTDALASGGYEGRGRLRQAAGSRQRALIRRFPNGATRPPSSAVIPG